MRFKCSAPGCASKAKDPTVSFHSFPMKDPLKVKKWIKTIPFRKKGWKPSKNSSLCSRHFAPSDFVNESLDKKSDTSLKLRQLKEEAIPSIWPDPDTSPPEPKRQKLSAPEKQPWHQDASSDIDDEETDEGNDTMNNDEDAIEEPPSALHAELSSQELPLGFTLLNEPKVALVKIEHSFTKGLDIEASLEFKNDLSFSLYFKHVKLDVCILPKDLNIGQDKLLSAADALSIAAFLGSEDIVNSEMLNCCCVRCNTGYSKSREEYFQKPKFSLHPFPKDEKLKTAWLRAIHRKDFIPTDLSRICSRHFLQSCFIRYRSEEDFTTHPLRLKPKAVPTIFSDEGYSLSTTTREESAMIGPRDYPVKKEVMDEFYKFVRNNQVNRFEDIKQKLDRSTLPKNINVLYKRDYVLFFSLSADSEVPGIRYGLKILRDLTFTVFSNDLVIPKSEIRDICNTGVIERISYLRNILEYLTIMCEEPPSRSAGIRRALKILKSLPRLQEEEEETRGGCADDSYHTNDQLDFIKEQLGLGLMSRRGRRYSSRLLAISLMWHKLSSLLYNIMFDSEILIIPCGKGLRKLKKLMEGNTRWSLDALTQRIESLNSKESSIVTLDRSSIKKSQERVLSTPQESIITPQGTVITPQTIILTTPSEEGVLLNAPSEGVVLNAPSEEGVVINAPSEEDVVLNAPPEEGVVLNTPSGEGALNPLESILDAHEGVLIESNESSSE